MGKITDGDADMEDEDLIAREDMVITVTHGGYVKRTPLALYRTQHRGGKGRSGMATKDEDAVTRVFSASTHTPVLFFATNGKAYKLKTWRLPLGNPQSRGKAFVNLLPIEPGDSIMNVLPLPENEAEWGNYDIMFATRSGDVRRTKLSDFATVNRAGKIAMKLEEGDGIIGVATCTDADDFLLTSRGGKAIRFPVGDVRVFKGRDSTGVRGIKLANGDEVVSLSLLYHSDATSAEARAYLKQASAARRAESGEAEAPVEVEDDADDGLEEAALTSERYATLGAREQFVLTLSQTGFGKRSSSYEYRVTGRGGSGIVAIGLGKKNSAVIASFPVEESDDLMMISDGGQTIRVAVSGISIQGRAAQGVTVFRVDDGERVVSVERIEDVSEVESA